MEGEVSQSLKMGALKVASTLKDADGKPLSGEAIIKEANKMVSFMESKTTHTEVELIRFGEYLLSKERTDRIKESYKEGDSVSIEERLAQVYHADIENWKAKK